MQQRVAELKLQVSELQNEREEMKKNLQDCHVVLVSAKIDPGNKTKTWRHVIGSPRERF